jgi:hypothetical protein
VTSPAHSVLVELVLAVALVATGCGPTTPGADPSDASSSDPDAAGNPIDATTGSDGRVSSPDASAGTGSPGSACSCDGDCSTIAGHAGVCVLGVCMTVAASDCSAGGSSAECAPGSRCWSLEGHDGPLCWPDCSSYGCDGTCDGDGSCAPLDGANCTYSCGSYCNCQAGDCGANETCVGGQCIATTGGGPGAGPGPTCSNLPARDCVGTSTYCGELVTMNPRTSGAYDDYPINGETAGNQYRSYLRRDLAMLVAYATAVVECKAAGWTSGIGGPLGLGDMSEVNGAIPGTSIGDPGHPSGTHTNGYDIDLAYYQINAPDNDLRPICDHTNSSGADQYHCTAAPDSLDVWRTALFLGAVFSSSRVRVVGVDGQAGPLLESAIAQLCADGWLSGDSCNNVGLLTYETTDMGYGWYYFHHHHAHISLEGANARAAGGVPCLDPACQAAGGDGLRE